MAPEEFKLGPVLCHQATGEGQGSLQGASEAARHLVK